MKVGIPPHYSYPQAAIIPTKNVESSVEVSPQQPHRTKNRNQLIYKPLTVRRIFHLPNKIAPSAEKPLVATQLPIIIELCLPSSTEKQGLNDMPVPFCHRSGEPESMRPAAPSHLLYRIRHCLLPHLLPSKRYSLLPHLLHSKRHCLLPHLLPSKRPYILPFLGNAHREQPPSSVF